MEEDQEQKFACKFCKKICASGMSLGGHMRGHLALISSRKLEDPTNTRNMDLEDGGGKILGLISADSSPRVEKLKKSNMGPENYGLRENPKKSRSVSNAKHSTACQECGKEFPSVRALAGHMRTHANKGKERVCKQCGKGFDSMRALYGHMRHHSKRSNKASRESPESLSDCETLCPVRRKRSRTRYKINGNLTLSNLNTSSSNFSIIGEEEEAAVCLLMLSRGLRNWVLESFQNDSEFYGDEPLYPNRGIAVYQAKNFDCDADETHEPKNLREKMDSCVSCSGNSVFEKNESQSGELENGFSINLEKKAQLEVSVDGIRKDNESGTESSDAEMENAIEPTEVELVQTLVKEVGLVQAELEEHLCEGMNCAVCAASSSGNFDECQTKREYRCRTCNKVFPSFRALGGHRSGSKTFGCCLVVKVVESHDMTLSLRGTEVNTELDKLQCNEESVEKDKTGAAYELKKSKDHECPICFKVFPSGQALGGHKRAHYNGFCENKTKESVPTEQEELPDVPDILQDLKLPSSLAKEANADGRIRPWWAGSDLEREPLVISN